MTREDKLDLIAIVVVVGIALYFTLVEKFAWF